jgi:SPP1 gp7 family putative phage head morphogenesis protein
MPTFRPPSRIEIGYRSAIRKMFESLLPKFDPNLGDLIAHLEGLTRHRDIEEMGGALASKMVRWVNIENAKSWREASARSQRSQMLYRLLQREMEGPVGRRVAQLVQENARLISSIPSELSQQLTHEIMRAQQMGSRPETIAAMMAKRYPELASSRIHLIARTETSKASTALTEARSEDLGLDWFEWETSEDQRVRYSHHNMDKVLVNWKDLPSPEALVGEKSKLGRYAPGAAPNCRCYPAPMLSIDDISWPHRVFTAGRITRMTRAQFQKLSGVPVRRIAA